jgi:cell division protein FtsB
MYKSHLRWQVEQERRKRDLVFFLITLSLLIYLLWVFFLDESGYLRYSMLLQRRAQLAVEIADLQEETRSLRREVRLLRENPFYIEKHAREDLNLSRPEEYIFIFDE